MSTPLRYDELSSLIVSANNQLNYINMLIGQYSATLVAIEANPDYATQTSAGDKTIIDDNQAAIVSANASFLPIPLSPSA